MHKFSEMKANYRSATTLRELADRYRISTYLIRKALEIVGVDYLNDFYKKTLQGMSCKALAKAHGISFATLRNMFKSRGFLVHRGRPRRRLSQADLAKAAMNSKSIREAAGSLGVRWATARNLLISERFAIHLGRTYWFPRLQTPAHGWSNQPRL
jgi:hypothetical protein